MKIQEVEQLFKDIFQESEGLVQSIDTVFEMASDESHYRLVLSIHNMTIQDTAIIHTKFIFRTDTDKRGLHRNYFHYLYEINCQYKKVEFNNIIDLRNKINKIIENSDFGRDITSLSDFVQAPAMFLNFYLRRSKITEYSVFDVKYDPKFKTVPCEDITFDFDININNNYFFEVSIKKIVTNDEELPVKYKFLFKFMDDMKFEETDSLSNLHFMIGSNIAKILDDRLKR
jgi:hypothetical protein